MSYTSLTSIDEPEKRYIFRDMRDPHNRHLRPNGIDTAEVEQVLENHYRDRAAKAIKGATLCRQKLSYECEQSSEQRERSTSTLSELSTPDRSMAGDPSPIYLYVNSNIDDVRETAKLSVDGCEDDMHVEVAEKPVKEDSNKSLSKRIRRRISLRTTMKTLKRFQHRMLVRDQVDMCLCGLLSLSLSVHLICCIEVFFSLVLLMQTPDLLTMDGTYFYFLGLFDGGGEVLFAMHVIMCTSCVLTALLLYIGSKNKIAFLLLPHLIWQFAYIAISMIISTVLMTLGLRGKMLLPSSIVLSVMLLVPAAFEVWCSYLTLCYYRQLAVREEYKLRSALESSTFSTNLISTQC